MTGQRLDDITSAVLLMQQADGKQTGWHIFNVAGAEWTFHGVGANGTQATVTVTGDFHRMNREGAPALPQVDDIGEIDHGDTQTW